MRSKEKAYDINQTDSPDVEAFCAADGQAVRNSCAAVVADDYDGDVACWRFGRGAFYFCSESREDGRSNSQFVVLLNCCAGAVAGEVWGKDWCVFWEQRDEVTPPRGC